MSSIFKSPKMPKAPDPVKEVIKTPTIDEATAAVEQEEKRQKRKGKASTILTADKTRTEQAGNLKTILGQ